MKRVALGAQTRSWPANVSRPPLFRHPSHHVSCFPARLSTHSKHVGLRVIASSSSSNEPGNKPNAGWRAFWATVDTGAWLGTIGTAIGFLLTQEALLVGGPILFPLLALYASRQRGRLDSVAAQVELQGQVATALRQVALLSEESAAEVAEEVAALVDEVRQGRSSPEKAVRSVEAKLAAMEDSMQSMGDSTKEALAEAASQRGRAVKELSSALVALRRDLNADLRQATGDELAALGRVDARLAALEGAVGGLEVAQSEGLRRLGSSVNGALTESREALAAAVRDEVWQSLEPVRQLPQALAAAAPALTERSTQVNEETFRAMMSAELAATRQELLEQQKSMLQEALTVPSTIAPSQWNQLGKRLVALDNQIAALKSEQEMKLIPRLENLGTSSKVSAVEVVSALKSEFEELKFSMAAVLKEQQAAQNAALMALAVPSSAENMLLEPLEMALVRLREEIRDAAAAAAEEQEEGKEESVAADVLFTLQGKIEGLITPVLEAISAARASYSSVTTEASRTDRNRSAALDQQVVEELAAAQAATAAQQQAALQQAATGIAALSEKIESLGERLVALGERVGKEGVEARIGSPRAASVAAAPGAGSGNDSDAVSFRRQPKDDDAEDSSSRIAAYERMQSLLHSEDGQEEEQEEKRDGSTGGSGSSYDSSGAEGLPAATGVPISDWLSGGEEKEGKYEQRVGKEQPAAVAVGSVSGSNTGGLKNTFIEEQIAFEAGLAAAEVNDLYESSVVAAEPLPQIEKGPPSSSSAEPLRGEEPEQRNVDAQQEPIDVEALYTRGLELLRQGRNLSTPMESSTSGNGMYWEALDSADIALAEASTCFQAAASSDAALPTAIVIKAIGNNGNALMARARVKRQLAQMTVQADGGAATLESDALFSEAKELLVVAGRRYREVLQADPSQGRAFVNWGRAVCLRAELAKDAGDVTGAHSLFCNAAEKFQAAVQLDAEPGEGLRLAGTALLSAAECLDERSEDAMQERQELLTEAEGLLVEALENGAGEECAVKLRECRRVLGWE